MTTMLCAIAGVLGWAAAVIVLGQSGTILAVPALAGWSISAVLGVDAARSRERVPMVITVALVATAALFVAVAVRSI
jgi:hypothetical protein